MKSRRVIRGAIRCPEIILLLTTFLVAAGVSTGEAALSRPGPADEPTRVDYGVYVVDVGNIDGANQNFAASVALALRWKDPRLASETGEHRRIDLEDVWHPRVMILNQQGAEETLPRVVEIEPDGTVSYVQRYWGQFSNPLRLGDFPFDHHEFEIRVLALGYTPEEINFVHDYFKEHSGLAGNLSIPDWEVGAWELQAETLQLTQIAPRRASFAFRFFADRYIGFFVARIFFPLVLIVFMSWVVFWIDPTQVASQISVSVTSILTLIAYRFALGNLLPRISYLTRMDYLLLGSTVLVFLALVEVTVTSRLVFLERESLARKLDAYSRVAFPSAFVGILLYSLFI